MLTREMLLNMKAADFVGGSAWSMTWASPSGKSLEFGGHQFPGILAPGESEQLRWYFEDYPELNQLSNIDRESPDRAVAGRVEALLKTAGTGLFKLVESFAPYDALPLIQDAKDAAISISGGAGVFWELLWNPIHQAPASILARTFVRTAGQRRPERFVDEELRILWVVSRPFGERDLPFRTVARAVMERLPDSIRIGSLRTVSLEKLACELREARDRGTPWNIVHFDGHGSIDRESGRGFAHFASFGEAGEKVHGASLGQVLADFGVSILVLNACRSAYALPLKEPGTGTEERPVAAFGSLAEEVLRQGVPAVLGMGYSVYPETAAHFASELYVALSKGATLGEATAASRRALWLTKQKGFEDWPVPVAYEAEPIRLRAVDSAKKAESNVSAIPPIERDTFVAQLEQIFERSPTVVIHGEAGVGKTTAALDFIRWFRRTRDTGIDLFTSFQRVPSVETLAFQSKYLAEQAAAGQCCIWVWDNMESVQVLPEEQRSKLRKQLRAILDEATHCRVLLTSRSAESDWLGSGIERLGLPRLNARESWSLASSLVAGRVPDAALRPLVEYASGNPLTLRMLVVSALRRQAAAADDTAGIVARLRAAEAITTDDEGAAATLSTFDWVFSSVLSAPQRNVLAVLKLFGSAVHPGIFQWLATPSNERAFQPFVTFGAEACLRLLHQIADLGVLHRAHDLFQIHPLGQIFIKRCWFQLDQATQGEAEIAFVSTAAQHAHWLIERREKRTLTSPLEAAPYEEYLMEAGRIARERRMYGEIEVIVKVLGPLFGTQNRSSDHWRLYDELIPLYVNPMTHDALPGRESGWNLIMMALEGFALHERDYAKAERLFERHLRTLRSEWQTARTRSAAPERTMLGNNLASALKSYAFLLRETQDGRAVELLIEAYKLASELKLTRLQSDLASDLAETYMDVQAVRDLKVAEIWIDLALRFRGAERTEARSQLLLILGRILLSQFLALEPATRSSPEGVSLIDRARATLESAQSDAPSLSDGLLILIEFNLASAHAAAGSTEQAHTWFHSVLKRAAQVADLRVTQTVHAILAYLAQECGRPEDAKTYAESVASGPETTPYDRSIKDMMRQILTEGL